MFLYLYSVHFQFLRWFVQEFFIHILSVLSNIRHSSLLPSSHSCFWIVRILFTYPEQFRSLFSLILWRPSYQNYSFQLSALILQILPVLRSSDLKSVRDPFVLMYLVSLEHLRSFHNSSRCFFIFSSFIFNSYGGSFKISLPSFIISIHSLFQPYRWFVEDLLKLAPYLS